MQKTIETLRGALRDLEAVCEEVRDAQLVIATAATIREEVGLRQALEQVAAASVFLPSDLKPHEIRRCLRSQERLTEIIEMLPGGTMTTAYYEPDHRIPRPHCIDDYEVVIGGIAWTWQAPLRDARPDEIRAREASKETAA